MKRKQATVPLALFLFGMIQIACVLGEGYTVKGEKGTPPDIPAKIVEKPKVLQRGESGSFSVKTDPQNTCWAGIVYNDESGWPTGEKLPEIKADEAGLCTWIWTVPLQAPRGIGHLNVQVGRGRETLSLLPSAFCIEECDD